MKAYTKFKWKKASDKEEEYEVLTLFLAMKKLLNLVNENGCKNVMFDNVSELRAHFN